MPDGAELELRTTWTRPPRSDRQVGHRRGVGQSRIAVRNHGPAQTLLDRFRRSAQPTTSRIRRTHAKPNPVEAVASTDRGFGPPLDAFLIQHPDKRLRCNRLVRIDYELN